MTYKSVYLLFEGDGTSMAAPKLVGATLNEDKAREWQASVPPNSWLYRSIKPTALHWTEEEES